MGICQYISFNQQPYSILTLTYIIFSWNRFSNWPWPLMTILSYALHYSTILFLLFCPYHFYKITLYCPGVLWRIPYVFNEIFTKLLTKSSLFPNEWCWVSLFRQSWFMRLLAYSCIESIYKFISPFEMITCGFRYLVTLL